MPKKEDADQNERVYAPVDPVYRIPNVSVDAEYLVERAITRFEAFEADRAEWMERRQAYYLGWDDYLTPIRKGPWENSSNVHLPMTEIQCNAMHARIMQAFFFIEPWFYVDPQEMIDQERIEKIELLMKYVVMRYANYNEGIYNAIDDWAWDLVTEGVGILSRDWKTLQRRHVQIVENEEFKKQRLDLEDLLKDTDTKTFEEKAKALVKYPYKEQPIIRTVFNGPIVCAENVLYILFKGDVVDCTDLNQHETVIKVCYFSRDELIAFKQSEYMDEDVVDEVLEAEPDRKGSTMGTTRTNAVEYMKDRMTGVQTQNANMHRDEYEFLCVWDRVALRVDEKARKSSLTDEVIYFVPTQARKLARWTYLDRVSANGKRNLHMAHLYRRPRRSIGRGMVETQFPMNDLSDLLINQTVDGGMLANMPMFGYRGNSTFDPQEVRMEPGLGLKMDDPNSDLRFFDWKINPNWSSGLQGLIISLSQQLTAIGPNQLGQVGNNVGPLRSNEGLQTLLGESGTMLDVVIKRAKQCYSGFLEGLYSDVCDRMPAALQVTVTGADGEPMLDTEGKPSLVSLSKDEVRGRVHFGLYANSQNLNRQAQIAAAMKFTQMALQPISIQSGVVQPDNIYELLMHVGKMMGIQRLNRFLSRIKSKVVFPLQLELVAIMQGIMPPISINDPEHQKKIEAMTELLNSDQAQLEVQFGMVNAKSLELLKDAIQIHQDLLMAQQKPTNLENPGGSNEALTSGQQGNVPQIGEAGNPGQTSASPGIPVQTA